MNDRIERLAFAAYTKFCASTGTSLTWSELPELVRDAWRETVTFVLEMGAKWAKESHGL